MRTHPIACHVHGSLACLISGIEISFSTLNDSDGLSRGRPGADKHNGICSHDLISGEKRNKAVITSRIVTQPVENPYTLVAGDMNKSSPVFSQVTTAAKLTSLQSAMEVARVVSTIECCEPRQGCHGN